MGDVRCIRYDRRCRVHLLPSNAHAHAPYACPITLYWMTVQLARHNRTAVAEICTAMSLSPLNRVHIPSCVCTLHKQWEIIFRLIHCVQTIENISPPTHHQLLWPSESPWADRTYKTDDKKIIELSIGTSEK